MSSKQGSSSSTDASTTTADSGHFLRTANGNENDSSNPFLTTGSGWAGGSGSTDTNPFSAFNFTATTAIATATAAATQPTATSYVNSTPLNLWKNNESTPFSSQQKKEPQKTVDMAKSNSNAKNDQLSNTCLQDDRSCNNNESTPFSFPSQQTSHAKKKSASQTKPSCDLNMSENGSKSLMQLQSMWKARSERFGSATTTNEGAHQTSTPSSAASSTKKRGAGSRASVEVPSTSQPKTQMNAKRIKMSDDKHLNFPGASSSSGNSFDSHARDRDRKPKSKMSTGFSHDQLPNWPWRDGNTNVNAKESSHVSAVPTSRLPSHAQFYSNNASPPLQWGVQMNGNNRRRPVPPPSWPNHNPSSSRPFGFAKHNNNKNNRYDYDYMPPPYEAPPLPPGPLPPSTRIPQRKMRVPQPPLPPGPLLSSIPKVSQKASTREGGRARPPPLPPGPLRPSISTKAQHEKLSPPLPPGPPPPSTHTKIKHREAPPPLPPGPLPPSTSVSANNNGKDNIPPPLPPGPPPPSSSETPQQEEIPPPPPLPPSPTQTSSSPHIESHQHSMAVLENSRSSPSIDRGTSAYVELGEKEELNTSDAVDPTINNTNPKETKTRRKNRRRKENKKRKKEREILSRLQQQQQQKKKNLQETPKPLSRVLQQQQKKIRQEMPSSNDAELTVANVGGDDDDFDDNFDNDATMQISVGSDDMEISESEDESGLIIKRKRKRSTGQKVANSRTKVLDTENAIGDYKYGSEAPKIAKKEEKKEDESHSTTANINDDAKSEQEPLATKSLHKKKQQLMRALKMAALEKAKAQLTALQLRKEGALKAKLLNKTKKKIDGDEEDDHVAVTAAAPDSFHVSRNSHGKKTAIRSNSKSSTLQKSSPLQNLKPISAYSMESLVISGIGTHGPDEKVRYRPVEFISFNNPSSNLDSSVHGTDLVSSNSSHTAIGNSNDQKPPAQNFSSDLPFSNAEELKLHIELAKRKLKLQELRKAKAMKVGEVNVASSPIRRNENKSEYEADKSIQTNGEIKEKQPETASDLRRRLAEMKESIHVSKERNRELNYEQQIGDLRIMIEKQRGMLAYHGDNVRTCTASLRAGEEQLRCEKQGLESCQKRLTYLKQRKSSTEKMVQSVTKKLMDLRKRRQTDLSGVL